MSGWPWKRRIDIGTCTLYLGDTRLIARLLEPVDTVLTDPVWPNCPAGLIPGSEDPHALWSEACSCFPPARRLVAVMRHDSDPRFLEPVTLPYARAVVLPYVIPSRIGRYLGGDELAYCFGEPIPSAPGQRLVPGRARAVQPQGRPANGHPCSRALDHFLFLVRWWSEEGETVLDPFMGSGTTGVACVKHGRKFIGIEIDETYFEIACERIQRAVDEPDMFIGAAKDQPSQWSLAI